MGLKRIRTVLLILIALSLISFSVYANKIGTGDGHLGPLPLLSGGDGPATTDSDTSDNNGDNHQEEIDFLDEVPDDYWDSVCSEYNDVGFCWEYFDSRDYFPESSEESALFEKGAITHVIENGGSIVVNEHHEITLADGSLLILEPGDILVVNDAGITVNGELVYNQYSIDGFAGYTNTTDGLHFDHVDRYDDGTIVILDAGDVTITPDGVTVLNASYIFANATVANDSALVTYDKGTTTGFAVRLTELVTQSVEVDRITFAGAHAIVNGTVQVVLDGVTYEDITELEVVGGTTTLENAEVTFRGTPYISGTHTKGAATVNNPERVIINGLPKENMQKISYSGGITEIADAELLTLSQISISKLSYRNSRSLADGIETLAIDSVLHPAVRNLFAEGGLLTARDVQLIGLQRFNRTHANISYSGGTTAIADPDRVAYDGIIITDAEEIIITNDDIDTGHADTIQTPDMTADDIQNSTIGLDSFHVDLTSEVDDNTIFLDYADSELAIYLDEGESVTVDKDRALVISAHDDITLGFTTPAARSSVVIEATDGSSITIQKSGNHFAFTVLDTTLSFQSTLFSETIKGSASLDIYMNTGISCMALDPGADYIYEHYLPLERSFHLKNTNSAAYRVCFNRLPSDRYTLQDGLVDFITHTLTFTRQFSYQRYLSNDVYVSADPHVTAAFSMDEDNIRIRTLELDSEFPRTDSYSGFFHLRENGARLLRISTAMLAPPLIDAYRTQHASLVTLTDEHLLHTARSDVLAFSPGGIEQAVYELGLSAESERMDAYG